MTRTETLLVACLHRDPERLDIDALARLDEAGWRDLFALAAKQRVRPMVHRRLLAAGGPVVVPERWWDELTTACRLVAAKNLSLRCELITLAAALARGDIPVMALKGLHVADVAYGGIAEREIGDLDLLVRKEDLARSVSVVETAGYRPWRESPLAVNIQLSQHATPLCKGQTRVELHWSLAPPSESYSIDPGELWHRSRTLDGYPNVLALSDDDLLLHLCAHAAYVHAFEFGLGSLCDLTQLIERRGPTLDWSAIGERATRWRWTRGVRLALAVAADLLGARVSDEVRTDLGLERLDAPLARAARAQVLVGYDLASVPGPGAVRARLTGGRASKMEVRSAAAADSGLASRRTSKQGAGGVPARLEGVRGANPSAAAAVRSGRGSALDPARSGGRRHRLTPAPDSRLSLRPSLRLTRLAQDAQ